LDLNCYLNLYFDEKNHKFSLFTDETHEIYFTYWHELKKHNIRYLPAGQQFEALVKKNNSSPQSRGFQITEIQTSQIKAVSSPTIYRGKKFSSLDFEASLSKEPNSIFINCTFEDIDLDNQIIPCRLAIIDSVFLGNFRLISCQIRGDLWLPNCKFTKHFSLKSSTILGDIHVEGSDFTGLGGVSFRGINANNLYFDLGVKGGDDLVWMNEITVPGVISIGGHFRNEIQVLFQQDEEGILAPSKPCIGSLIIGHELYEFDSANQTVIEGNLRLDGLKIRQCIRINKLTTNELSIRQTHADEISIQSSSTYGDLTIAECSVQKKGIFLVSTSIGRHLKLDANNFNGCFSLYGSAVSEVTYFEDNALGDDGSIELTRFTTARFLIHPPEVLHAKSKGSLLKPKSFDALTAKSTKELGEQYCSLKHWFSDAGKLKMEDIAFFHMRQKLTPNRLERAIFGGVFGWGVRLSNITFFSLVLIVLFSIGYFLLLPEISFTKAMAMSAQSFISSFFGNWSGYPPDGLIANIVTFESLAGILFITVFIGAYIRKLLR